jgi:Glucodextranase, domain B
MSIRPGSTHIALVAALAALVLAFVLEVGAAAAVQAPPVTIDTVTVADGTATVNGAVANADATVHVNGTAATVDSSGTFQATVDLGGAKVLVVTLGGTPGETTTLHIPLSVITSTDGQGVLDGLLNAGIRLDVPADGFRVVDGQMPLIEGRVLNGRELAALEINGASVLGRLGPNGRFSIVQPGGSSSSQDHVTVTATDRNGVSQTTRFKTVRVRSTIRTTAGTSVSAAGARGIVIAKVKLDTHALRSVKRFGIVVTIKDRRGYLVRGATVRLKAMPSSTFADGSLRAGFTSRLGVARFTYRLSRGAIVKAAPQNLAVGTKASTVTSHAALLVKLRLPAVPKAR